METKKENTEIEGEEKYNNVGDIINYKGIKWLDDEDAFKEIQSLKNLDFYIQFKISQEGGCYQLKGEENLSLDVAEEWIEDYEYYNGGDVDGANFDTNKTVFEDECFHTLFLYRINSHEFKQKIFERIAKYKETNNEFYVNEFCDTLNDWHLHPDDSPRIFLESILGKDCSQIVLYEKDVDSFGNILSWSIYDEVYDESFQLGVIINN